MVLSLNGIKAASAAELKEGVYRTNSTKDCGMRVSKSDNLLKIALTANHTYSFTYCKAEGHTMTLQKSVFRLYSGTAEGYIKLCDQAAATWCYAVEVIDETTFNFWENGKSTEYVLF